MAAKRSRGPRPYKQAQISTTFIRVPTIDWPAVKLGQKREFRAAGGPHSALWSVKCPTPVVAYRKSPGGYDEKLMVLEDTWREKLVEISPESLEAEGFGSFDAFRSYWIGRERRRFMPMAEVTVYRLRPFQDTDVTPLGKALLERLYGDFL